MVVVVAPTAAVALVVAVIPHLHPPLRETTVALAQLEVRSIVLVAVAAALLLLVLMVMFLQLGGQQVRVVLVLQIASVALA